MTRRALRASILFLCCLSLACSDTDTAPGVTPPAGDTIVQDEPVPLGDAGEGTDPLDAQLEAEDSSADEADIPSDVSGDEAEVDILEDAGPEDDAPEEDVVDERFFAQENTGLSNDYVFKGAWAGPDGEMVLVGNAGAIARRLVARLRP